MIEQYDPVNQMMSLRQVMNRLLEDAFVMPREGQATPMSSVAVNVYEEGDNLIVEAQLPGINPEDIDVTLERGLLTIRGETRQDEERRDRNYLVREHRYGAFMRTIRLPETVDPDGAEAKFENGVLRLMFPKSEKAKARHISVGQQQSMTAGGRPMPDSANTSDQTGAAGAQSTETGTSSASTQSTSESKSTAQSSS